MTLALATTALVIVGWLRSHSRTDAIVIPRAETTFVIESRLGRLTFEKFGPRKRMRKDAYVAHMNVNWSARWSEIFNRPDSGWAGFDRFTAIDPDGVTASLISVPYWALSAISAALSILVAQRPLRKTCLARLRYKRGCCTTCGYDLRQTPHRCPECGAQPN